jgi:hypothetical protein
MHTSRDPADPRPRIRRQLADLVEGLERDAPSRVILACLVDAARRLALKLEGNDLARPSRRRAGA